MGFLSLVEAHRLSCPAACEILVPQPGIEPTSPALEGRFFTTGPPGKSLECFLKKRIKILCLRRKSKAGAREDSLVKKPRALVCDKKADSEKTGFLSLLMNPSSRAQRTVRSNEPKPQSLEQRKVYCRAKQGEWVAHVQKTPPPTPRWFSGKSF